MAVSTMENKIQKIEDSLAKNQEKQTKLENQIQVLEARFSTEAVEGIFTLLPKTTDPSRPANGLELNGASLSKNTKDLIILNAEKIQKENSLSYAGNDAQKGNIEQEIQTLTKKVNQKKLEYKASLYVLHGYFNSLEYIGIRDELFYCHPKPQWKDLIRLCISYYSQRVEWKWNLEIIEKEIQYLNDQKEELLSEQQKKKE